MKNLTDWVDLQIDSLENYEKRPLEDLLVAYHQVNDSYQRLDAERKRLYRALDRLNKSVIPAKFRERDIDQVRIRSLGRSFYPLTKYSARVSDKGRLFEWLREVNAAGLIGETVNAGTLASFLKERMMDGEADPPEEVAELTSYQMVGSSKYTPK